MNPGSRILLLLSYFSLSSPASSTADGALCSTTNLLSTTLLATTSDQPSNQSAQTPPASVHLGVHASRPLLLLGFMLGSLAVMSGFRPLEPSSFSRVFALFELRSILLSVVVFFVLLVLAYLTNPSEASFRAFLTEQAFRHHLSRLDDIDAQDDSESSSIAAKSDALSRRGLSSTFKNRALTAYSSPPFAFASRASVSLRTPKHIFRSFGILSVAAVVPTSPSDRSSSARRQSGDEIATRSDKEGGSSASTSISESWFIGAFGMWFWTFNLDGLWRDAGLISKDEVDGTITGVLGIKALDRSDEPNRTPYTSYANGQRSSPKLRSRERLVSQNGNALHHRSQTPPPLPKSASLPLHAKRGPHILSSEKSSSGRNHQSSNSFAISSAPSAQPPISITPDFRSINASPQHTLVSSASPSAIPSRSPSALFASSPLIAEILRQLSSSQNAISDLRSQLSDFNSSSVSARASLDVELEKQRERKRADDAAKAELKAQTKALEDQKRTTEAARRETEKRLRSARLEKDNVDTRIERYEREISKMQSQMEAHGAAIVTSGEETSALAADLEQQVDAKRSEIRSTEDDVAQLSLRLRDMEEQVADEETRLKDELANAEERKQKFRQANNVLPPTSFVGEEPFGGKSMRPQLQAWLPNSSSSDENALPLSPVRGSIPDSPLTVSPIDGQVHHTSRPLLPTPMPLDANKANGFQLFTSATNPHSLANDTLSHRFAPFSNDLASPGPFSPTGESLIPSSLYESLGMGIPGHQSDSPVSASEMNVSRSFQSADDVILERNWLNHRNGSAGDVGQAVAFPAANGFGNVSPESPAISMYGYDGAFGMDPPLSERASSLRMDTQRASFLNKLNSADFMHHQMLANNVPGTRVDHAEPGSGTIVRRNGWFASNKDKSTKIHEKKGLNPDAKEFSLSKDKERSFSAFLSRSRGSGHGSSSGTASTPSTASVPTPEAPSLGSSPSLSSETIVKNSTPKVQSPPHARTAGSLLSLGHSWFGSSHAFAPTPLEREQLSRALGGPGNASFDKLERLSSLPTSPQPNHVSAQNQSVVSLPLRSWDVGGTFGQGGNSSKSSSTFSPFDDEGQAISLHSGSSSPSDGR